MNEKLNVMPSRTIIQKRSEMTAGALSQLLSRPDRPALPGGLTGGCSAFSASTVSLLNSVKKLPTRLGLRTTFQFFELGSKPTSELPKLLNSGFFLICCSLSGRTVRCPSRNDDYA